LNLVGRSLIYLFDIIVGIDFNIPGSHDVDRSDQLLPLGQQQLPEFFQLRFSQAVDFFVLHHDSQSSRIFFGWQGKLFPEILGLNTWLSRELFPAAARPASGASSRRPSLLTTVDSLLDSNTPRIIAGLPKKPVHALATTCRILKRTFHHLTAGPVHVELFQQLPGCQTADT
jgi:hypothetical protein